MRRLCCLVGVVTAVLICAAFAAADGKVVRHRNYQGQLEEFAQEAIIIFHGSDKPGQAVEELILKIGVKGNTDKFGWVVPFPREPKVEKEDVKLFHDVQRYVLKRTKHPRGKIAGGKKSNKGGAKNGAEPVEVLSREVVGSYDVAVVRENEAGALNAWLDKEGFQKLPDDSKDVLDYYRQKGYVFACMKVTADELAKNGSADLHPLRFTFATGGSDGIYFPMKMTGLQTDPFDVNLFVFSQWWLNHRESRFGFTHRDFELKYRDKDRAHGGAADPSAQEMPTMAALLKKLYPGQSWYLTNLRAKSLRPRDVRAWTNDLWLFPSFSRQNTTPDDAEAGGVASSTLGQQK